MDGNAIAVLLVLALIAYVIITYRQLLTQHQQLNELTFRMEDKKHNQENTDVQRREYNRTARAYNHKLDSFIGKIIAKRQGYAEVAIIEKHIFP